MRLVFVVSILVLLAGTSLFGYGAVSFVVHHGGETSLENGCGVYEVGIDEIDDDSFNFGVIGYADLPLEQQTKFQVALQTDREVFMEGNFSEDSQAVIYKGEYYNYTRELTDKSCTSPPSADLVGLNSFISIFVGTILMVFGGGSIARVYYLNT